ncbi:E3 ubiquitin-protein ligase ATL42 [Populus alba x Populus x berolinensis]|uniref:RING-type E3 ubiquitin transferase n=1 Tax=Populus alba x Populus x berolinensis TaxID=444605 RepID=A0AAD6PQX1_9ROSI|nr:E3 ubiquitin-protein ligase ATL42 [Populus alba x Populus x berolinensis]
MNRSSFITLQLLFVLFRVQAQNTFIQGDGSSEDAVSNFQPSLAIVIGILFLFFTLTFILLIYAKFCHRGGHVHGGSENGPALTRSASRFSGIDRTVIESLPFFRFTSLKGSREGLECAVCLSKFEDIEILRLLPQCKHAFHINCVDQWLEKHSSCPLCRRKVNPEDPTIFTYSNSMRYLGNQSELREDSNVELFVQREENRQGSSRFSFRKSGKVSKEEELWIKEEVEGSDNDQKIFNKFKHKIIVSDVVLKNRWSSASSSDLMFLNSEMLHDMSSNRFHTLDLDEESTANRGTEDEKVLKIKEEIEMKRLLTSRIINSTDRRSVSEITAFSRFRSFGLKNTINRVSSQAGSNVQADRQRQLWLPIARRTVQWFANRETRIQQTENTRHTLDV